MVVDGITLPCSRQGCGKPSRRKMKYCSASCRAKASHAKNYVKRGAAVAFVPKPRDPAKRAERDRWRRLLNEIKGHMSYEEAREWVRFSVVEKLVSREQQA